MHYPTSLISLLVATSSTTIRKAVTAFTVHPTTTVNGGLSFRRFRNIHDNTGSRLKRYLGLDRGWNNDQFLEALNSGSNEDMQKANADYYRQASRRADMRKRRLQMMDGNGNDYSDNSISDDAPYGGEIQTQGMPGISPEYEENNSQGGQMFQRMMEQANQSGAQRPQSVQQQPPPMQQPQSAYPGAQQQQPPPMQQPQSAYPAAQQQQPPPQSAYPGAQQQQPPPQSAYPGAQQQQPPPMQQPQTAYPGAQQQQPPPMQQPQSAYPAAQQQQPPAMQQPQGAYPGAQQQQQPMDPWAYYQIQLQYWQDQMMAFAQFKAANPQAAASMTMPPPPPPPTAAFPMDTGNPQAAASMTMPPPPPPPAEVYPTEMQQVDTNQIPQQSQPAPVLPSDQNYPDEPESPREYLVQAPKGGANKDSFEISNPSDVWLAQLKRDTYVRNVARSQGDLEKANKPLDEKGVRAIKGVLSAELLVKRREQQKAEAESANDYDESTKQMMIEVARREQEGGEEQNEDRTSGGVSYREKLEEARKRRMAK